MDDLLGEDWQKPATTNTSASAVPITATAFASSYSSLRGSPALPLSGSTSPASLSRPSSTVNGSKAPTNDSFGNLVSLKTQKAGNSLSMQERQKQLLEEKRRQQDQQAQLWDSLGSGKGTPEIRQSSPASREQEDDILAAFNKDAPVNRASHFAPPPPSSNVSGRSTPAVRNIPPANERFDEDDDPFGLNEFSKKSNGQRQVAQPASVPIDEDDILGDLGRPIEEQRARPESRPSTQRTQDTHDNIPKQRPREQTVAPPDASLTELLDMGFPVDTVKIALAENGGDVQRAVGWLLQQAHEESRQKARTEGANTRSQSPPRRRRSDAYQESVPSWMRNEDRSGSRRGDEERGAGAASQEFGAKFLKSANALWKAGQKQVAKTIADMQQDGDPNQPKWMRDGGSEADLQTERRRPVERPTAAKRGPDMTDEAALLDAPRQRPQKPPRPSPAVQTNDPLPPQRVPDGNRHERPPAPTQMRPAQREQILVEKRTVAKLSRQDVEEQSAQAYISPARRKRPTPNPEPVTEPEVDLFSPAAAPIAKSPPVVAQNKTSPKPPVNRPSPSPARVAVPPRTIPPISPSALSSSASHRKAGGEHFKRGDYAAAHDSYTAALTPLPPTHPLAVIVLSNRSLTALKTGDAKVAVADADRALEIIGPGLGAGETIDLGAGEGAKEMKDFYGKALMRKAEALEHMEKYADAAAVWRLAIEGGIGGAVSIRGRDRCEKAANPGAIAAAPARAVNGNAAVAKTASPPKSMGNSLTRPTITSASSHEAVRKLRAANAEAEKADDEKFALADIVDAKLTAWRGGKTDNLRALLQSMDAVLWEGAGWKKVGMSDLVMPNKVKIVYMKAIGKVHPDKIPQDATTEQRMISGAVFATLNEAWDKFKTDNNL